MLGIDQSDRLFYEGSPSLYGHGIWPSPFVSTAALMLDGFAEIDLPATERLADARAVFREDSFDPVTRLRRGRLYEKPDGMSNPFWHVQTHPALRHEINKAVSNGLWQRQLDTFRPKRIDRSILLPARRAIVALGTADSFTLWTPVSIERISTGDDLVTLRARTSLGLLPELAVDAVPRHGFTALVAALDKVADSAYRHGAESVIDRCRDGATVALGLWLDDKEPDKGWRSVDLGRLVKRIRSDGKEALAVLGDAANSIARLHARGKPNVEHQFGGRALVDSDADCAIAMLGVITRELGWAAQ
ncbi:hypothetical protein [Paraburkholderia sediminicola]|uniref:hypothetical protein n=1 Tax=Paraburkholderia sediminicola TaxID=458836 RepID=UPI0038B82EAF